MTLYPYNGIQKMNLDPIPGIFRFDLYIKILIYDNTFIFIPWLQSSSRNCVDFLVFDYIYFNFSLFGQFFSIIINILSANATVSLDHKKKSSVVRGNVTP